MELCILGVLELCIMGVLKLCILGVLELCILGVLELCILGRQCLYPSLRFLLTLSCLSPSPCRWLKQNSTSVRGTRRGTRRPDLPDLSGSAGYHVPPSMGLVSVADTAASSYIPSCPCPIPRSRTRTSADQGSSERRRHSRELIYSFLPMCDSAIATPDKIVKAAKFAH